MCSMKTIDISHSEVAAITVLPGKRGKDTMDVVIAARTGVPGSDLLKRVREEIQQAREIAVDIAVFAPVLKAVDVSVQIQTTDNRDGDQVRNAVKRAVQDWFTGERLSGPIIRAELGRVICAVEGVKTCVITAPAADIAAEAGVLPALGIMTLSLLL